MLASPDAQHILIVDDDPLLQSFLEDYLSQHNYNVTFCKQGENMESLLQTTPADLVILDILLPGKDGFYWLDWLKNNHPAVKVIMLSVKNQDIDKIQGLESGAQDYLCKPFNPRELLARINNLLQHTSVSSSVISFGAFRFDTAKKVLTKDDKIIKLTNAELVFLSYLCKKHNQLVTRDDLSHALRGSTHNPLDRSIDVHINRLRGKIENDPSTPRYIRTIWGKGYLFQCNE